MKKRIWIVLIVIWVLVCHFIFVSSAMGLGQLDSYNLAKDVIKSGDYLYACENMTDNAFVYNIDMNGNVQNIRSVYEFATGTKVVEIIKDGDYLYALISKDTFIANKSVQSYNIIALDDQFNIAKEYRWFRLDQPGAKVFLSSDRGKLYISTISDSGTESYIYSILQDDMVDFDASGHGKIREIEVATLASSDFVTLDDGYRFIYTYYKDGTFLSMKNGCDYAAGAVGNVNDGIAEIYDVRQFNFMQIAYMNKALLIKCVMMMFGGSLLIISIFCIFRPKNRLVFWILMWELTLLVIYAMSSNVLHSYTDRQHQSDYKYYADYVLRLISDQLGTTKMINGYNPDYYFTGEYRETSNRLLKMNNKVESDIYFEDICIVSIEDGRILMSYSGYDGIDVSKIYGKAIGEFIDATFESGQKNLMGYNYDGSYNYIVANRNNARSVVMGIISAATFDNGNEDSNRLINTLCTVLFIISSVIGIIILLWQSWDLRRFGSSLEKVSAGEDTALKKPDYIGEDIGDMWNGLLDIDRNIKNLNFIRYRVFEAFYRFAPKSMERVLEKKSITDVESGDYTIKEGTIATIEINNIIEKTDLGRIDQIIEERLNLSSDRHLLNLISEYQESGRGFQVSFDGTLSDLTMLFPEGNRKTCDFGKEFFEIRGSNEYRRFPGSIFLHYDTYAYGVVGVDNQFMQYLVCESSDIRNNVLQYVIRKLRLRLVISEAVYQRELDLPSCRYIGTVMRADKSEEMRLYEVLDVCCEEERRKKEENNELFQKGIELFRMNKFYTARNTFAQVIKNNPMDTVAKWYVFACEKYINSNIDDVNYSFNQN